MASFIDTAFTPPWCWPHLPTTRNTANAVKCCLAETGACLRLYGTVAAFVLVAPGPQMYSSVLGETDFAISFSRDSQKRKFYCRFSSTLFALPLFQSDTRPLCQFLSLSLSLPPPPSFYVSLSLLPILCLHLRLTAKFHLRFKGHAFRGHEVRGPLPCRPAAGESALVWQHRVSSHHVIYIPSTQVHPPNARRLSTEDFEAGDFDESIGDLT